MLVGLLDGACQRQQHRLQQVALTMEQIGAVGHLESLLSAAQQASGLVTGQLQDFHWHALDAIADGLFPGVGVTPRGVAFDQDEIGNGLDGDQAVVRAVEVLVGDDGDAAGLHLLGQLRLALVAEGGQVGLEVDKQRMQGPTRAGDEAVESSPLQESTEQAQSGSPLQAEGGESGQDDSAEEVLADAAVEEVDEVGMEVRVGKGGVITASPVADGGAGDASVLGILSLGVWVSGMGLCLVGAVCHSEGESWLVSVAGGRGKPTVAMRA